MQRFLFSTLLLFVMTSGIGAQVPEMIRLTETFSRDSQYHVACQVEITGSLPVPGNSAKSLAVTGKSSLRYDERILRLTPQGRVDRTIRTYQGMEFQRKVGTEDQQNQLRPQVRRLVIMRHQQYEVPFCPTGPLTWGEIELVRTDVFAPALAGLFPAQPVRVGERWNADNTSIQELTDLERIDRATFVCTLEKVTTLLGRRTAHVKFDGKVEGISEDGKARHELRGSYYVDIDANFMTDLSVRGTHHLLDKAGTPIGKIEGSFVMTRARAVQNPQLSDEALRGLTLEPNSENTMLLFEHPQSGTRLQYPRSWRIAGVNDRQIGIDENRGTGMLITLSPARSTPSGAQFFQETVAFLSKQQVRLSRYEKPRLLQTGIETFLFEGEIGKDNVLMQYYTVLQNQGGATIAARFARNDPAGVRREAEGIVRSLQLGNVK